MLTITKALIKLLIWLWINVQIWIRLWILLCPNIIVMYILTIFSETNLNNNICLKYFKNTNLRQLSFSKAFDKKKFWSLRAKIWKCNLQEFELIIFYLVDLDPMCTGPPATETKFKIPNRDKYQQCFW